ncbi:MAG: chromosome segregation protein SMC [Planctomycetaceae bacterium]
MTRLKALELYGFKSFADRTRFEFPDGVTAVVGPNGSGKSNVVDAIKWVLGEQSVRSLRGKEMSDVIFAGSGGRRPLNYAEVSLVFDNASGELPVDTPEVQIMRRVQRDGESEYLVNGEVARLRDVRELFSGTGAATQAYSVIEQGRVDALLVASGRDRRAVFAAAAGITRFRARRVEALRRLERAELNRQRLADIVGEVSSRLETVRHQAARARRGRQMNDRLKGLRLAAARVDLLAVDAAVADVDAALAAARAEAIAVEARATESAADVTSTAAAAESLQPRLTAARAAVAADTQRAATAEATLALQRTRRADVERDVARSAAAAAAADATRRTAAAALADAERATAELVAMTDDLAARIEARERSARGTHSDVAARRQRLAETAAALDIRRQDRLRLEAAVEAAATRAAECRRDADAARDALEDCRLHAARLAEAQAAWEGNVHAVDGRLAEADRRLEGLQARLREQTEAVQGAWRDLAGWQARLEACRERCDVLRDLVSRHDGLSDAARRLLAAGTAGVPGLAGALADLLVARVEWAPLVDVALGGLGQSLVIDSLADAVRWHADWAGTPQGRDVLDAGGRIGFVAATPAERPAYDPAGEPGVVGRLDRLVAGDDGHGTPRGAAAVLLDRLLGRVWIVERIAQALPLVPSAPAGTLFVSRAGDCLSADGTFEIGVPAAATGLVARRAELRALEHRHAELTGTTDAATARVAELQGAISDLRADIAQAQDRRREAGEASAASRGELDRVHRERHAAEAAAAAAERALKSIEQRAGTAAGDRHSAVEAFAASEPAFAAARDAVTAAQAAIDDVERSRGEIVEEIQRLRVEQATASAKLSRCREEAAANAAALAVRDRDVDAMRAALREAERRHEAHELELLAAGAIHAEAAAALERSTAALADAGAESAALDARRSRATATLDTCRAEAARLAEAVHAHELEAGEARHRRARIVERIRDEYDIDIEAVVAGSAETPGADPPVEIPAARADVDREIEELRRKLASMTTVNLEALAESEELAARLTGLEAQLADITSAKDSIGQLIARIDDESRRLLGETIETVRGHFRDLFERLFGGGQADIVLEEGVDLLETAVEIVARPPGKEPRSISLLSGGEKTMTCVALLLAIFKSRPSPFCVLDEVDAALDESNVDRFVGVIRDFLSTTQFIVVTHSKKTMAAADTLYGVTQEESGVSTRVAVRFESAVADVRPARAA